MASDIKKDDSLDEFWSFINGDSVTNGKSRNDPTSNEDIKKNTYYSENSKTQNKDDKEQEIPTQSIKPSPRAEKIPFDVVKTLKSLDDFEAFGKEDELDDNFTLSTTSEDEENESTAIEKYTKKEQRNDDFRNTEKDKDKVFNKKYDVQQKDVASDSEKMSGNSVVDIVKTKLGLYSTALGAGIVVSLLISIKLLYVALGTVKDFVEYVAVCAT